MSEITVPAPRETVSRWTTEADLVVHMFQIVGYSLKRGIGLGEYLRSGLFRVGGGQFSLRFYPDGLTDKSEHPWLLLVLESKNAEVHARYEVRLVKRPSGSLGTGWSVAHPNRFCTRPGGGSASLSFELANVSRYVHDDCLAVRCQLTVLKESKLSDPRRPDIAVPPPSITSDFAKLLADKEMADVTFSVGGEAFLAHKLVLVTRSPVFKGQLCGPMRGRAATDRVTVDDMQPEVFRALLHFIYTDSLPDLADLQGDDYCEMIRHLLVAADIYALERLKTICQSILAKNLDVETVATTLGLADLHNCDQLKDACIEFFNSSNEDEMQSLLLTEGYASLKRSCPSVIVEVFERSKRRKT